MADNVLPFQPTDLATASWQALAEPPDIPDDMVTLQGELGPTRWYEALGWAVRPEGYDLYAAVVGDSGAEGGYVIAVYCFCPPADGPTSEGLWAPRFPTFEEWTELAAEACVPGTVLNCSFIVGAALRESEHARQLLLTQTGALPNTPAAMRWALANPVGLVGAPHG